MKRRISLLLSIIILASINLSISVRAQGSNPIVHNITLVADRAWEGISVFEPTVIREDGIWKMWYSGGGDQCSLGYAVSLDGIVWTKYIGNPVLGQGKGGVSIACRNNIIKWHNIYYCFFVQGVALNLYLYVATSRDGIEWNVYSDPVFIFAGWEQTIANTYQWVDEQGWHMVYDSFGGGVWKNGIAYGPDPYHWMRLVSPVSDLSLGGMYGGGWLETLPGGIYRMWYHAALSGNLPTDIYTADSADLIHWYNKQLRISRAGLSGIDQVADPSVVVLPGGLYRVYYDADYNVGTYKAWIEFVTLD